LFIVGFCRDWILMLLKLTGVDSTIWTNSSMGVWGCNRWMTLQTTQQPSYTTIMWSQFYQPPSRFIPAKAEPRLVICVRIPQYFTADNYCMLVATHFTDPERLVASVEFVAVNFIFLIWLALVSLRTCY